MVSFRLKGPLTDQDFLDYYRKIKSSPDFYSEKFGEALFSESAYWDLAAYIEKIFKPQSAIDIGCGKGKMVEALLSRGVETKGMDWSEYFIKSASPALQRHLECTNILTATPLKQFDLVICMETLSIFHRS